METTKLTLKELLDKWIDIKKYAINPYFNYISDNRLVETRYNIPILFEENDNSFLKNTCILSFSNSKGIAIGELNDKHYIIKVENGIGSEPWVGKILFEEN